MDSDGNNGDWVWRFRLDSPAKTAELAGDEDDAMVEFAREQIRALMQLVVLRVDGRRVYPDEFALVSRPWEAFKIHSEAHA